jgi:hypothetical protein
MPKIVDRFQDHQTGGVRASKFEDGRGPHVVDCAQGCWFHAECWRRLGAFKGADRNRAPTAELTPARSIRIVEKVTQGNSGIPIFSGAPPSHPSVQSHRP